MSRPADGDKRTRTIRVDALSRVEGEGSLFVRVRRGVVEELNFRIFEPPRYFEALLRGRPYTAVPDLVSRICGICPFAYIFGASAALEAAFGAAPDEGIDRLRRLAYCGEWVQSHALHTHLLHAPDYLGSSDALGLETPNHNLLDRAIMLKRAGNAIVETVGGRAVHPVNTRVGGFYRAPDRVAMDSLAATLEPALAEAIESVRFFAKLPHPDFEDDYVFVALHHPGEYPMQRGRVVSSLGLDIPVERYEEFFAETQVPHSTALQGVMRGLDRPYILGPLARYALNAAQLSPLVRELAAEAGLGPVVRNPHRSIVIRSLETVYALEEALRLARAYEPLERASVALTPRAGRGCAATEAPRGLCFHRYETDDQGRIAGANIMPPTSQNQPQIERDLRRTVEAGLALDDDALRESCERAIRNYDPCISCATHFLRLEIVRD
jgi:coenzyme F420-reducing hydrogenase alpha subunit